MTIQERDNGTIEIATNKKTLSAADLFIVTTPTGLYAIEFRGVAGIKPAITEDRFTSLSHAKQAIKDYLALFQVQMNKRAIHDKAIERRKAEYEAKDGKR